MSVEQEGVVSVQGTLLPSLPLLFPQDNSIGMTDIHMNMVAYCSSPNHIYIHTHTKSIHHIYIHTHTKSIHHIYIHTHTKSIHYIYTYTHQINTSYIYTYIHTPIVLLIDHDVSCPTDRKSHYHINISISNSHP